MRAHALWQDGRAVRVRLPRYRFSTSSRAQLSGRGIRQRASGSEHQAADIQRAEQQRPRSGLAPAHPTAVAGCEDSRPFIRRLKCHQLIGKWLQPPPNSAKSPADVPTIEKPRRCADPAIQICLHLSTHTSLHTAPVHTSSRTHNSPCDPLLADSMRPLVPVGSAIASLPVP